ncbi:hypothetical protein IU501_13985 [Nocardia otitidiscaviarum]|uniref:hypothetical protein n=1 Tax=Nocardia otitidiscaviarum TaxID=1823 RepID=UPI000B0949A9|nr:hypothetical protein [Nocardia otitidiscaviarum]MBF6134101.1 hypothetical protein [Nocardia otitidiscaviarum]MBF6484237.1 hypothetical protein [Nocardia otitidiscaviarum]
MIERVLEDRQLPAANPGAGHFELIHDGPPPADREHETIMRAVLPTSNTRGSDSKR